MPKSNHTFHVFTIDIHKCSCMVSCAKEGRRLCQVGVEWVTCFVYQNWWWVACVEKLRLEQRGLQPISNVHCSVFSWERLRKYCRVKKGHSIIDATQRFTISETDPVSTYPGARFSKVPITKCAQSPISISKFKEYRSRFWHPNESILFLYLIVLLHNFQKFWDPHLEWQQNSFNGPLSDWDLRETGL